MNQPELDFSVPVQSMGSLRTRHASSMGAVSAKEHAARQALIVLQTYQELGPATDAEVAERTGIMRSSVIPRRRELEKRGFVVAYGFKKNPNTGVTNTTFGLP